MSGTGFSNNDYLAPLDAIADEMRQLAIHVEQLGDLLCADAALLARHGVALQAIDLIVQQQRALAAMVAARDEPDLLSHCQLGAMAARLAPMTGLAVPTPV